MQNIVHKMLVHGPEISQILELPIGLDSEELQEAQKKSGKQGCIILQRYPGSI